MQQHSEKDQRIHTVLSKSTAEIVPRVIIPELRVETSGWWLLLQQKPPLSHSSYVPPRTSISREVIVLLKRQHEHGLKATWALLGMQNQASPNPLCCFPSNFFFFFFFKKKVLIELNLGGKKIKLKHFYGVALTSLWSRAVFVKFICTLMGGQTQGSVWRRSIYTAVEGRTWLITHQRWLSS